jgi:hypothetical protein
MGEGGEGEKEKRGKGEEGRRGGGEEERRRGGEEGRRGGGEEERRGGGEEGRRRPINHPTTKPGAFYRNWAGKDGYAGRGENATEPINGLTLPV